MIKFDPATGVQERDFLNSYDRQFMDISLSSDETTLYAIDLDGQLHIWRFSPNSAEQSEHTLVHRQAHSVERAGGERSGSDRTGRAGKVPVLTGK